MSDFTTWRSLVDGEEIARIPDSEVLDDFADSPTVTSSEITDRDDFSTTPYAFDTEERFAPSGSRPDYTIDSGSPSISDESLVIVGGSDNVHTPLDIDLDSSGGWNWEFEVDWVSGSGNTDNVTLNLASQTTNVLDQSYDDSYSFWLRDDENIILARTEDGDDAEPLIETGESASDHDNVRVERDENGNWEVFLDGTSFGTATDTSMTDMAHFGFAGRSDGEAEISKVEIYPNESE